MKKVFFYPVLTCLLLTACNNDNTAPPTLELPTHFQLEVAINPDIFDSLGTANIELYQPTTGINLTESTNSEGSVSFTLPQGYDKNSTLEITATQGNVILKALSAKLNMYAKSAVLATEAKEHDTKALAIELNTQTTAEYVYLDNDGNGSLSETELTDLNSKLDQADSGNKLKYIRSALEIYIKEGEVEGTQDRDSYALVYNLFNDEKRYALVLTQNYDSLNSIVERDYPNTVEITDRNAETDDFFRIDYLGQLLTFQNLNYSELPWECVDDLRATAPTYRKYGYGIHMWHYGDQESAQTATSQSAMNDKIEALNAASLCGVQGWSIPTVEEFEYLYDEVNSVTTLQFPLSFPFINQRYYWVNQDNTRKSLVPVVYDTDSFSVVADDNPLSVSALYKSWVQVSVDKLLPPSEQTTDEKRAIYAEVKVLYADRDPATWPAPTVDENVAWLPLGLLSSIEIEKVNTVAEQNLGKKLFFDARLSQNRNISCASCHIPSQGWEDNLQVAIGHAGQEGTRNTPSLLNVAHQKDMFWDGRNVTLEQQALKPISNPIEMNLPQSELETRINEGEFYDYKALVIAAYGTDSLSGELIASAIAAYERTIRSNDSEFDEFLRSETKLSSKELWGLHLFRTKAKCMNCHSGPNFTNGKFENLGLSDYNRKNQDLGRYNVTLDPEDVGKFKVPSLRELTHSAPYMHTGRFDLTELLTSYNNAMGVLTTSSKLKIKEYRYDPLFPEGSDKLDILRLTDAELDALEGFLKTLSSDTLPIE